MNDGIRSLLLWLGIALTFGGLLASVGGILWDKLGNVLGFFEVDIGDRHSFRVVIYGLVAFLAGLAIVLNLPSGPMSPPPSGRTSVSPPPPPPPEPTTEE